MQHEIPHFASENTDWKYVPMKEVREFSDKNDMERPNFLQIAIKKGFISESRIRDSSEDLNEYEMRGVDRVR